MSATRQMRGPRVLRMAKSAMAVLAAVALLAACGHVKYGPRAVSISVVMAPRALLSTSSAEGPSVEVVVAKCDGEDCDIKTGQLLKFDNGRPVEVGCVSDCALVFTPENPKATLWLHDGWYALRAEAFDSDDSTVASYCTSTSFGVGPGRENAVTIALSECLVPARCKYVAAGGKHSLALDEAGNVWAWGSGLDGRLGTGSLASEPEPVLVLSADQVREQAGPGAEITKLAAGMEFSLALDTAGNVWGWGDSNVGQLAKSSTADVLTPAIIVKPSDVEGEKFVDVSAGGHALALTETGKVYAWGRGGSGQLGDGSKRTRKAPTLASTLGGVSIASVAAGDYHSLALDESGHVWAWGSGQYGQIGNSDSFVQNHWPAAQELFIEDGGERVEFSSVAAGNQISFALEVDGDVWAWGWGVDSVLGSGGEGASGPNAWRPTKVVFAGLPPGVTVQQISVGHALALAVDSQGNVWAWGQGDFGQLGTGGTSNKQDPVPLTPLPDADFKLVAAGGYLHLGTLSDTPYAHSLAIDGDGNVWAWGKGTDGQVGTGESANKLAPVMLTVQAHPTSD